jgi:flagellar FliL protein
MAENPKKDEKTPEDGTKTVARKGEKLKIILMGVAGVALLGGAVVGGMMWGKSQGSQSETAGPQSVEDEIVHDATESEAADEGGHGAAAAAPEADVKPDLDYQFSDAFIVNLDDPSMRWYLQTSINLKASSSKAYKEIVANVAPLRDATIMILSSKTREDLRVSSGKKRLKKDLLSRYDGILEPDSIEKIRFMEFRVARK